MKIESLSDILLASLTGVAVVFAVLVLVMLIIYAISTVFKNSKTTSAADGSDSRAGAALANTAESGKIPAPGSLGEIKLFDTSERDAALIMAIVADKLGAPLNTLYFKSIKKIMPGK